MYLVFFSAYNLTQSCYVPVCNFVVHDRCLKTVVSPCSSKAASLIKVNLINYKWLFIKFTGPVLFNKFVILTQTVFFSNVNKKLVSIVNADWEAIAAKIQSVYLSNSRLYFGVSKC